MKLSEMIKRCIEIDKGIPEKVAKNMSDDELKSFRDDLAEFNGHISAMMLFVLFVEAVVTGITMLVAEHIMGIPVDDLKDTIMVFVVIIYLSLGIMIPYAMMGSRTARYTKLMEKRYYK